MKIIVAVSGGMDSLWTLLSLKEQGHDVAALHARFIKVKDDPVPALAKICKDFGIPLHIADVKDEFNIEVIRPFLNSYREAKTPNPCAVCNKTMKFGRLLDIARNCSAEKFATGHYVCMENYSTPNGKEYGPCLHTAKDDTKDQSYFLALTPLDSLRHCLFPLAREEKAVLREELKTRGIQIPHEKESQEVCFIPSDDYRSFLEYECERRQLTLPEGGDIVVLVKTEDGIVTKKIDTHNGLWHYTEGQRRGLGIAWTEPLYVIKKDSINNILYVGAKDCLNIDFAFAEGLNFLVPPTLWPEKIFARTRFREKPMEVNAEFFMGESGLTDDLLSFEKEGMAGFNYEKQCSQYDYAEQAQYLHHIREEESLNVGHHDVFEKQRAWWNSLEELNIKVHFSHGHQVYAAGQILALYDENGFVLAGGTLK